MVYSKLQKKEGLSPVQSHIADYVLEHTDRVLTISMHELAESTNTSTATIIRFCKKLGVEGYKEFQISLL